MRDLEHTHKMQDTFIAGVAERIALLSSQPHSEERALPVLPLPLILTADGAYLLIAHRRALQW